MGRVSGLVHRSFYGGVVRGVPWWGVVSSGAAPVLLVGGWTLAAWLQPGKRGLSVPWGLRPGVAASAVAVLLGLLVWFVAELFSGGALVGLAERVLGAAQALWPLAVILSCRRGQARAQALQASHVGADIRR